MTTGSKKNYNLFVATMLRKRFARECGRPNAPWLEVASWMVQALRPTLPANTWRAYRNAVKGASGDTEVAELLACPPARQPVRRARPRTTRSRELTTEQLRLLTEWCADRDTTWGEIALRWMRATLFTGLRPAEWTGAALVTLEQGTIGVRCRTIKRRITTTRMLEYRTIPLTHLSDDQVAMVREHIEHIRSLANDADAFEEFQEAVRNFIKRAARDLWGDDGPRPTLYSGRHQFKTNCYSAGLSDEEIAVLMGQVSETTAPRHYGHANPLSSLGAPRPLAHEVAAFRTLRSPSTAPEANAILS